VESGHPTWANVGTYRYRAFKSPEIAQNGRQLTARSGHSVIPDTQDARISISLLNMRYWNNRSNSRLTALIGLGLLAFAVLAETEIYKWVDEEGNVHYSDCAPPPTCDAETIQAEPEPDPLEVRKAQERLERMLAEQEVSKAEREQETLERERQRVAAMKIAVARKQICIRARQNLHVLQVQRPVYYIDENGKYVYLDDETRLSEIARMMKLIDENCQPISE